MLQTFLKLHYFVCCTKLKRHLHTSPLRMRDVYSWRFYSVHLQTTKADDVCQRAMVAKLLSQIIVRITKYVLESLSPQWYLSYSGRIRLIPGICGVFKNGSVEGLDYFWPLSPCTPESSTLNSSIHHVLLGISK